MTIDVGPRNVTPSRKCAVQRENVSIACSMLKKESQTVVQEKKNRQLEPQREKKFLKVCNVTPQPTREHLDG